MKRISLAVVTALVVITGAELAARSVEPRLPEAPRWYTSYQDIKIEALGKAGPVELLVLGSSIVNTGLRPSDMTTDEDVNGFNLGLPADPPRVWRDLLTSRLVRTDCLATIVMGVTVRDVNASFAGKTRRYEAVQDTIGWRGGVHDEWLPRLEGWLSERLALVRTRSRLREPGHALESILGHEVAGWQEFPDSVTANGWDTRHVDRTFRATEERLVELGETHLVDYDPSGPDLDAVADIAAWSRQRDVEAVVLLMPTMESVLGPVMRPGATDDLAAALASVAAEEDATFLDARRFDNREELFADQYHLNIDGARAVSSWVGRQLDIQPRPGC